MTIAFRVGSIPVRVHAWLIIVAALLGLTAHQSPVGLLFWIFGIFVAMVVHELAHAVTARAFGVAADVDLAPFAPPMDARLRALTLFRRTLVVLAGPAGSLVLGAVATALARWQVVSTSSLHTVIGEFAWLNLAWGAMNLVPMLPFDGGYVLLAVADRVTHGRGEQPIRVVSAGLAVTFAFAALLAHLAFPALLFGVMALQNARSIRAREAQQREVLAGVHMQAAFGAIEREDVRTSIHHCVVVLGTSSDARLRKDATRLLAYGFATTDAWRALLRLLETGGAAAMDDGELEKYERAARELGRHDDARRIATLRAPDTTMGLRQS